MFNTASDIVKSAKSAMVGNLAEYDTGHFQNALSSSSVRETVSSPTYGRTYSLLNASKAPVGHSFLPVRMVSAGWSKLRSIGEYDAKRTR